MTSWFTLLLVVVGSVAVLTDARAISAEPVSIMMDPYGNPVLFVREKRTPVHPYPHRAMMFTGYYRPARRTSNVGQATGVYAQGNAVSGGAYLGESPYLKRGPEPVEEITSAEAEAAPESPEQDQQDQPQFQVQDQQDPLPEESEYPVADPEPVSQTESAVIAPAEEPVAPNTEAPAPAAAPVKPPGQKKSKKTPLPIPIAPADQDDEDVEDEDEEPIIPFLPPKGNRRRQGYVPNLNNFFPMVFSFPGGVARAGSSGSPPGAVTAIANSYSTAKGGVASSVATAYGGSPNGKKQRRAPVAEE
ncbi:skin secretory protein xP2 [Cephus cinctus]|uniref:Skin secretory protein xP2 n=1 Tax=Cephus cinctus TaxID=211228 RepID=A0AAJ7R9W2_CEPCN|nr:skin secretory protein xP2 [Cephus cinctus]